VFKNFFPEIRAVYEMTWINIVEPDRPQFTIWHMRIVCWMPKATNTHSEYVTVITFTTKNSCTKTPQWYVIHTLPVFCILISCLSYPEQTIQIKDKEIQLWVVTLSKPSFRILDGLMQHVSNLELQGPCILE
jgi:hypothetical protein